MKCDFLLLRTLSAFNLLKQVGFALLLLGINLTSHAQPPDTLWTRRYGTQNHDIAYSVAQLRDGSFIMAGKTWNFESFETRNSDAYVVKIDSLGNEIWSHSWGTNYSDGINKILVLEDGYLAAGTYGRYPPSPPEPSLGWLLRLDSFGDTIWTATVGHDTGFAWFEDMIAVEADNFVTIGRCFANGFSNFWMVKFNSDGDTLWTQSLGGNSSEYGWAITLAQDGGYVACGYTGSFGAGAYDSWLIKVSPDGDSLWSHSYGYYFSEETRAIARAQDGGFFLGGYTSSYSHGYDDAWIVRTDSDGNFLWDTHFASPSVEGQLDFYAIVATEDGGAVGVGQNNPASTNGQALFMGKVDSTGDSVWARSWFQSWYSYGEGLTSLSDGGFAAVGTADWHTRYEAYTTGDIWFLRISPDMSPVSPSAPFLPSQLKLSVFPNPFNSTLSISLNVPLHQDVTVSLYDLLGREVDVVYRGRLASQTISYVAPAGFASGVYFLRASANSQSVLGKVVLLK